MSYFITKTIPGTSEKEYVLDEKGRAIEFPSSVSAALYMIDAGYTLESMDEEGFDIVPRDGVFVELDTFPESIGTTCVRFVVEKDWLIPILESLDSFNERKGVDLDHFLSNYGFDETDLIHELAKKQGKILHEEVIVDGV